MREVAMNNQITNTFTYLKPNRNQQCSDLLNENLDDTLNDNNQYDIEDYIREKKKNELEDINYLKTQAHQLFDKVILCKNSPDPLVLIKTICNYTNPCVRWKRIHETAQLFFSFMYAEVSGDFLAFTCLTSNDFQTRLRMSDSPADFIRSRLNPNFKNNLGYIPEYMFIVEYSPNAHIHGIIKVPHDKKNKYKNIMKVTLFGSNYRSSPLNSFIVKFSELNPAIGWLSYCLKGRYSPTKAKLIYKSNNLRNSVKSYFGL